MPTKRTPLRRSPSPMITPQAIQLFEKLRRCRSDERWSELHARLHDELHCRPWEWPCVEDPHTEYPYPSFTNAHRSWRPNERAQQTWKVLDQASREARAARNGGSTKLPPAA